MEIRFEKLEEIKEADILITSKKLFFWCFYLGLAHFRLILMKSSFFQVFDYIMRYELCDLIPPFCQQCNPVNCECKFNSLYFDWQCTLSHPLDERGLSTKKGAYPLSFIQVRQRGELNWASQLQPSGQQISSAAMSRPESILIKQD